MQYLGIDIGSKTIKLAIIDGDDGSPVYSTYVMHRSQVKKNLVDAVHSVIWRYGDRPVRITVTGSAGMRVAELFGIPFVQEVVALKRAVERYAPDTDVVLEMGGEDTKLIYITGMPEQRMNNVCAGGTGSFIEMMAGLMGVRVENMNQLAMGYFTIYPIASRCAVFAKSDVRPLLNAGAKKEDIAASVLDAVCTQAVAGLSAGRPLAGKVLLLGGPFERIPALREAFCRVTGFSKKDAVVPQNAHLFVAHGAAISPEKSPVMQLSEFEQLLRDSAFESEEGITRLPALFNSREEYEQFRERHGKSRLPRAQLPDATHDLFLGVDAGSTTVKVALIDSTGALVAYQYGWNEGDVGSSLTDMLLEIFRQIEAPWAPKHVIRRSCIVGYGEDFCRAAFGIDAGEVETVAHLRAAYALEPDVDFLMDIGGQDIKCFYVDDGMIEDVVLNEACSSGCGSLFDSVARSMRRTKEGFAAEALYAKNPVDLGTRCATFMDSRIKHAQKEGVPIDDIAAGVCYSTARNALFKVVRQPDFSKVGDHIVVQGGAFANDALLRAFEKETSTEVIRPDLSAVMGAWGAALLARDAWLSLADADPEAAAAMKSNLISSKDLADLKIRRSVVRCQECGNHCQLMVTRFLTSAEDAARYRAGAQSKSAGRAYVTGNRCEKGLLALGVEGVRTQAPPNMMKVKNALIAACDHAPQPEGGMSVGVPKALALYESYPFWAAFFNALGCAIVPHRETDDALYRKGMSSIPAEGMCYPAKLVYGQLEDMASRGAQLLFVPNLSTSFAREGLLGLPVRQLEHTCPLVENLGTMAAGNSAGTTYSHVALAAPDLTNVASLAEASGPIAASLAEAGLEVSLEQVEGALAKAQAAYRAFFDKLAKRNATILADIDAGVYPGALVSGHGYHSDPGISHGIDGLLGSLGYAVLEHVDYDFAIRSPEGQLAPERVDGGMSVDGAADAESRWYENVEVLNRARIAKEHPNLQFIVLRSFGCGIDALVTDAVHDELRGDDCIYAELKIDQIIDLAAVRIRLRSLAYARRQREGEIKLHDLTVGKGNAAKQREAAKQQRELAELARGRRGDPERTILQIAEDGETVIPLQRCGNRRFPLAGYTDEKGVDGGSKIPVLPPPG